MAVADEYRARFDRPVFIVSSPRSGSSLLFETLAQGPGLYTIGGESHALIEGIPGLHPFARGWTSNVLTKADAIPAIADELSRRFYVALRDRDGVPANGRVRMIEKTPKNSLRVPFLAQIFPGARFVFLYRDVRETLSSMIEAWESGRFVTYPRLPDWPGLPWSLLLVPGWRALTGLPLAEIVAWQWARTLTTLLDTLATLPADRMTSIDQAAFLAAPQETASRLMSALDLHWDRTLPALLPLSPTVVSAPVRDKWRRHEALIEAFWPIVRDVDARAREVMARLAIGDFSSSTPTFCPE